MQSVLPEIKIKFIDFNNTHFFLFLTLCIGAKTKQYKEMLSDVKEGLCI
jgi:predicted ABC-type exoprotein transport system permease subunit